MPVATSPLDLESCLNLTLMNNSKVALWLNPASPSKHLSQHSGRIKLALPDSAGRIRRRPVGVAELELQTLVDALANLGPASPAPAGAHALAAITRLTLGAVAEGRVLPRLTPDRNTPTANPTADWAVGPWKASETADLRLIADHLPAELRADPIDEKPLRVHDALSVVSNFADAVASAIIATPAARRTADTLDPIDVTEFEAKLVGTGPVLVATLQLESEGAVLSFEARNRSDHTTRRSAANIWADPDEASVIGDHQPDMWLLRQYKQMAGIWPPMSRLLAEAAPASMRIDDEELGDFLTEAMDQLSRWGLEVLLPRDLLKTVTVKASISSTDTAESSGAFSLVALCEIEVTATLDGTRLTDRELNRLTESNRSIVRIRDSFVRVDAALASQFRRRLTTAEALGVALSGELVIDGEAVEADVSGALAGLVQRASDLESVKTIESVDGLQAELRHYQQRGVAWLKQVSELVGGGILADDMGLGKTLQIIALHLLRQPDSDRPTLVVGPASLVTNWIRELARFAPLVGVHRYHGKDRDLSDVGPGDIVVSTYATVRLDRDKLAELQWDMVIADEAQFIKNHSSATAKAVRSLQANVRIAVSGTPVENQLNDLWSLANWTVPGLLGTKAEFRRRYANPIERDQDSHAAKGLNRIVAPFVLRRTKSDPTIAPDLPPRTELDHIVPLSPEQAALYRAMTTNTLEQIELAEGIQRRGLVLKLLGGLKQICDHPALYLDQSGPLAGRSGKLAAFDNLVSEMVGAGDGILVFTQYVGMGNRLTERLTQLGIDSQFLHGGTTQTARQRMVDCFQDESGPAVFVISIKAGGTGLNLTRANQVIHYDRWWNPAVENQASDRAWRIGQERPVFVHRLTSEKTLEETIGRELKRKAELAESVISGGEGWLSELDDFSLRSLVELAGP